MASAFSRWNRARPVLLIWLVLALGLVAFALPSILALKAADPDDYMRLAEVRDWLAGQSWFDVRQHRMGLPPGADMHWSRLVDLPIAALLVLARLFVTEPGASAIAMALIPLVELLVAMLLLHRLMLRLGVMPRPALAATAMPLLFPVLTSNFMPMRIDHHAWQAICALSCALAICHAGWRGSTIAGLLAALWLSISLEGLALVMALTGLMAWRTLRTGEPALAVFSAAFALGGLLLTTATRPLAALPVAQADQLSWPHLAAFAIAALIASAGTRSASVGHRVTTLALAATAAASVLFAGLGAAAIDPFHTLDPLVRQLWLDNIPEGLPITRQDWQTRAILLWTPLIVLAGWLLEFNGGKTCPEPVAGCERVLVDRSPDDKGPNCAGGSIEPPHRPIRHDTWAARGWNELAVFALAACALSFLLMRGAVAAQLLAVPFSAVLLARLFPRAAALPHAGYRIPAMLACIALATPILASTAGRLIDRSVASPSSRQLRAATGAPPPPCDLSSLARLPRARILAPLDLGPEILVRTGHSVVAGSYHRNSAAMRAVIEVFSGDPARAPAIATAQRATLLVFCPANAESAIYAARRTDSLANTLAKGEPVAWLRPLPDSGSGLKVYRVVKP